LENQPDLKTDSEPLLCAQSRRYRFNLSSAIGKWATKERKRRLNSKRISRASPASRCWLASNRPLRCPSFRPSCNCCLSFQDARHLTSYPHEAHEHKTAAGAVGLCIEQFPMRAHRWVRSEPEPQPPGRSSLSCAWCISWFQWLFPG
jgi:hypothetical protein